MTTGPPFSWPLPVGADVPAIPTHLGNLGGAISDSLQEFGITGSLQLQHGTTVRTPDGTGTFVQSFPKPFGAGPVVIVSFGDTSSAMTCKVKFPTDANSFTVTLYDEAGAPVTGGQHRINWIALGTPAP